MDRIFTEPYNETHKKIVFIVEKDKKIPDEFLESTPDFLLDIMWIAKKILRLSDEVKSNKEHVADLQNYRNELENMRNEYERTIMTERSMKRKLEQSIQEKDNAMKIFEQNINRLIEKSTENIEKRHGEEMNRLIKQNTEDKARLEASKKEEILRLEISNKTFIENMRQFYNADKEKIERDLKESFERVKELQESIRLNQVSAIKGSVGQNDFFELVKEHTTWTGMEDTSKTSRAGDLRGYIDKVETMFEVKNYTSDVPSKEVVKMIRDLETHSNIAYGVFVSMNTGIAGKKKTIDFQWTAHGQLCIFISNLLKYDIELVFNYIGQCASIAHRFFTLSNNEGKNELESYKDKLMQVKIIITKQILEISEMIATMMHHKKLHVDNLNKHYTEYKLMLEKMKLSCNEIIDIVVGDDIENVQVDDQVSEPQEEIVMIVKKRGRKKKSEL